MGHITGAVARVAIAVLMATAADAAIFSLSAGAVDAPTKCAVNKLKLAGKYGNCRLQASAKAVKKGVAADFSQCDAKLGDKWVSAEAKGSCPTSGDLGTVVNGIDIVTDNLGFFLVGERFIDNGDGTITDTSTQLMWEKKADLNGSPTQDYSNPHDPDNQYKWSLSQDPPDGELFTDFLARLNNCGTSDGTHLSGGFAGHCDWRVPTITELASLVSVPCGPLDCVDQAFPNDVGAVVVWSSTTSLSDSNLAWALAFVNGMAGPQSKGAFSYARAVRGGLPPLNANN